MSRLSGALEVVRQHYPDVMAELYDCKDGKTVRIICSDSKEGKITRKGDLVFINSFGKTVRIPFTFSYTNKGW